MQNLAFLCISLSQKYNLGVFNYFKFYQLKIILRNVKFKNKSKLQIYMCFMVVLNKCNAWNIYSKNF